MLFAPLEAWKVTMFTTTSFLADRHPDFFGRVSIEVSKIELHPMERSTWSRRFCAMR
jgi:hypothetical protein